VLDGTAADYSDDVSRLPIHFGAIIPQASPSEASNGTISLTEQVLDGHLLAPVRRVVGAHDLGESFDASDRALPESLVIQLVVGHDGGCSRWIAGGEHRHHLPEHVGSRRIAHGRLG
jgi:hypothetical protein